MDFFCKNLTFLCIFLVPKPASIIAIQTILREIEKRLGIIAEETHKNNLKLIKPNQSADASGVEEDQRYQADPSSNSRQRVISVNGEILTFYPGEG